MVSFDVIRARAARLHHDLIKRGVDATSPLEIARAAIRSLDLTLDLVAAGDPVLNGALALFDAQSGTVCCSRETAPSVQASLIAHEVGHAILHSRSASCAEVDVDVSQTTEASPIGIERVEDYGGRERRELQANVFARELLLPRSEARRRYLEEGLSASEISRRLHLPKNLVRQQLLDALLLPAADEPNSVAASVAAKADQSQTRATTHRGSPFQLQAGPGTGKTRTLVNRVVDLIRCGTDPAAILVLTFSNRAAGELSERISSAEPEAASKIWVGTFHSFGLDLIRRYHDQMNLPVDPKLFDKSDAIEMLEEILPTLGLVHYRNLWDPVIVLRDIVAAISRAKDEICGPERYRELASAMLHQAGNDKDQREVAERALEVSEVYKRYETVLHENGAVDFGDLIMRPVLLLESNNGLRDSLALRHRHVLVDEYQDVNRASARLLKAIAGDGTRLWVVGDARQSIYRFRGASSANMTLFASDYAGAVFDRLSINYRSSGEIVSTLVGLAPHMGSSSGMLPLNFSAERGSAGHKPQIRRFDSPELELAGIAESIRELEQCGVRLRDQAVLCRSNARMTEVATSLEAAGIPVLHLGSLFEREEIRDLLALLSLDGDAFGSGLARVATMPRYNIPMQDVYAVTSLLRESKEAVATKLRGVVATGEFSIDGITGLKLLASDLASLPQYQSPWEYLTTYLFDIDGNETWLGAREGVSGVMRTVAIWQFLNFVRAGWGSGSGPPIRSFLHRVRNLVLLAEERDLRQVPSTAVHVDAVRLMTVHGSKGLEFDAVHVPGLVVSSFPTSRRGQRCPPPDGLVEGANRGIEQGKIDHDNEEQCLFFVALSRARAHLRLYLSRKQAGGKNRNPSLFLPWIEANCEEVSTRATSTSTNSSLEAIPIDHALSFVVTDSMIGLYEKCPRRFFYTHILQLKESKKPTAYSRTHDCIYDLIRWLADTRLQRTPNEQEVLAEFARIWTARGPTGHAFASQYLELARRLVSALVGLGGEQQYIPPVPLPVSIGPMRLMVEPNEMTRSASGTVVRRVKTRSASKEEFLGLEYALYALAAQENFDDAHQIEALHLADERVQVVTVPPERLRRGRDEAAKLLDGINCGRFDPVPDSFTCPRCPHFFICAATPRGSLSIK